MLLLYILVIGSAVVGIGSCFIKNKTVRNRIFKILLSIAGFFVLAFIAFLFIFILPYYIGTHGFWLPFAIGGAIYLIFLLLMWKPFKAKVNRILIFSIAGVILLISGIFSIPEIYRSSIPQAREEVNLSRYTPFGDYWYVDGILTHHDSEVIKLDGESSLKLDGDLPRLDGATALYPLYSAFVRATYPVPEARIDNFEYFPHGDLRDTEVMSLVVCSRTAAAFENLVEGYADVVFLMGVSDEQRLLAEQKGLELVLTPIGREAFVFFVNSRNRVTDITENDIRGIYSGQITNWREIGGGNNEIRAYQRPDESGSQTKLKQIMGDTPLVPAPIDTITDTMMMMYERVAGYKNYRNSLGYSFLYYIRDMINENKVKFLSINGIAPTPENITNGTYPFADDFYAVTVRSNGEYMNPERTENIEKLLEWILSAQGQYLVEATGYVPVR